MPLRNGLGTSQQAGVSGFHFSLFSLFFPISIFYYYFLSIPLGMKRKRSQINLQLLLRRPSIQVQIHRDEQNCGQKRRKEICRLSLLLVGPVPLGLHSFSPLLTSPDLLKLDLSSSLKNTCHQHGLLLLRCFCLSIHFSSSSQLPHPPDALEG